MSSKIASANFCAAILAFAVASPAIAAEGEHLSWGKAGVSFDQYRADAIECGRAGYYLDIAETEQAQVFKQASSQLETNEAGVQNLPPLLQMNVVASSARIVEGTRPSVRFRELKSLQNGSVAGCLIERGYTRFKLTEPQQAALKRLRRGSPERHHYLHRIASDPGVLRDQLYAGPQVHILAKDTGGATSGWMSRSSKS
jgi:hypothetical protein